MDTAKKTYKGDCVAVLVNYNHVQLWFSSPTGDSSDSQIRDIICTDERQAELVAKRHREVWGLD
jgi:hypothetical protein